VKNVLIIQTIGAGVIFFLFKWPYVFGVVPLQCDFVMIEGKTVAVTNAVLISFIVILNIAVYVKTRYYARPDRNVSVSFVNNNQPVNPEDFQNEPQQASIRFEPNNASNVGSNNTNTNDNQQGTSNEPSPITSPTTTGISTSSSVNNNMNLLHNNMPLQMHGGNRQMEVIITVILKM